MADLVIRARRLEPADLELIRTLIAQGQLGRCQIALELCRRWHWVQSDGKPKEAACRALLLRLNEMGLIELPSRRRGIPHQCQPKQQVQEQLPLFPAGVSAQQDFPSAVQWRLANSGTEAHLYKDLIRNHHYLGYCREVGQRMRYVAYSAERPIACIGWAAAAWTVADRDRFIGWNAAQRQEKLHLIANNTRFLVLTRVPHLASHLLAGNIRRLASDWKQTYGYSPALLETFVDTTRFQGTCYKAANWVHVGQTQGRGKYDRHTRHPETIKAVFLYPLDKNYRQILTHD